MHKYKLEIAYDGAAYSGWQLQPNATSIQGILEEKFFQILREKIRVVGSGRTDAGVHALGQVAHFTTTIATSEQRLQKSINALLPSDIKVLSLQKAPADFHAQYCAHSKIYHYHLWLEKTHDPFLFPYRYRPKGNIELSLLKEAIPYFIGIHDFSSFANVGSCQKSNIRNLFRLDCIEQIGGVRFELEADGFLYKMVRNIVGTLIEVARRKLDLRQIPILFDAKDRKVAPMSVPGHALFLVKVNYDNGKKAS